MEPSLLLLHGRRPRSLARLLSAVSASPWPASLFLFLLGVGAYCANHRLIAANDSRPAQLIPFSILLDRTVTLDRFYAEETGGAAGLERMPADARMRYYHLTPARGRLYSTYPIALPVLVTPLYVPVVWARRGDGWSTGEVLRLAPTMEKRAAAVVAALSVVAMYWLLSALADRRLALVLALGFAFGTTTWTTSSQALWQHGAGVLFILLSLAVLARRPDRAWLAGLFAGVAMAIRPTNLFFWIALVLVGAWTSRSLARTAALALPGALAGAATAAYNWVVFHDLRGGYAPYARPDTGFRGNFAEGLAGVLASPSRGLFVYSPFLLAGVAGLYVAWRRGLFRGTPVYAVAALFLASQLVCIAAWVPWWGGYSYGPRLLTEAAAVLVVLSVPAAELYRRRRWAAAAFAVLLAYSVGVQALGAFAYGRGDDWNDTPVSVELRPGRLWDWRDSQIRREAADLLASAR
ncbi:MAG TPA: hypothetical protein VF746_11735 [Longimicrobium sp.]|jgi:hypothetical protein